MKILLGIFILTLPLMCSKSTGDESSNNYSESVAYEDNLQVQDMKVLDEGEHLEAPQEQMLIKESFLRFETQDLEKTYQNIAKFTSQNNGFVQDDASTKSYNQLSRRLIIRIPTRQFQKTIDSIANYVTYFDTKQITSKDVTEEFIDIEARLKAKETLEARYLELLKKANSVKEILEIERELSTIREEIEAKQGRLRYLQNKVSLSTLTVEFYKITSETGATVSYGQKMWNAITSGFDSLSFLFLGVLYMWPFLLLFGIAIFIFRQWMKKRNKKQ